MKKIFSIVTILFILTTYACKQQQEQKQQQMTYTPAPPPALLPIDQMKQAAKMEPKNAPVWINLGNTLMDAQRFGEAVDAYEKALALEPKNVNVLVDLGTCYRGVGKFDRAVEQYRKALKINPNFPNGHRNLGVVLAYDLHNKAEGIKEIKRYLELAPTGPDADSARKVLQELNSSK